MGLGHVTVELLLQKAQGIVWLAGVSPLTQTVQVPTRSVLGETLRHASMLARLARYHQVMRYSPPNRLFWSLLLAMLAMAISACATVSARDDHNAPSGDEKGDGDVNAASDTWEPIEAHRLLPLEAGQNTVRVRVGADKGDLLVQRIELVDEADDEQRWIYTLEERQRIYLGLDEADNIVIFREDDFSQGVSVHYEPALIFVPAIVDADTRYEQQARVIVRHLDSGAVRSRGTTRHRIEAVRFDTIETEAGSHQVYVLRQERELDLSVARASVRIETVHAPDLGRIAWDIDHRTRILGFLGSQRTEGYELASP